MEGTLLHSPEVRVCRVAGLKKGCPGPWRNERRRDAVAAGMAAAVARWATTPKTETTREEWIAAALELQGHWLAGLPVNGSMSGRGSYF